MKPLPRTLVSIRTALLTAAVIGACGGADRPNSNGAVQGRFTDITSAAGLGSFRHITGARGDVRFPETMGSGGGFFDFDSDGFPDILLVGGGAWEADDSTQALWLYRNRGDGTFEDVTLHAGLAGLRAYGMGATTADVDGDGDQDIYMTAVGQNVFLRNDNGVYTDATTEAGLDNPEEWSTAAVFFDADGDGWVDLLVGNYVEWSLDREIPCYRTTGERAYCTPELYHGLPPRFYRNRGDGTFEERTGGAGFADAPGKTLGLVVLDFNRDGQPDIAVANDTEADQLYENQGDGTFRDVGLLAGLAFDEQGRARAGMGIDAGDVDGDGRVSIFVGNFDSEMSSMFTAAGERLFEDRSAESGLGAATLRYLTFGMILFDADLDGDLDLLSTNGHIDPDVERYRDNATHAQRVNLFLNDGRGRFSDVAADASAADVLATRLVGRGAAVADVDLDGDLDVLLTVNGGGAYLWRNDARSSSAEGSRYLRLSLVGSGGNRDALGAMVRVMTGDRQQTSVVRAGNSYLSISEKALTFGLRTADRVDSLEIQWPNGEKQVLVDIDSNQRLTVVQGQVLAP